MSASATPEPSLYLSDAAIARQLGIGKDRWRANAVVLEKQGLPRPDPLFGHRRYWPAVRAFLDRRAGLGTPSPGTRPHTVKEDFHAGK